MEKCTVLCSDDTCAYKGGCGVYGVCKHPNNADRPAYSGITRMYMSSCAQRHPICLKVAGISLHSELMNGQWGNAHEVLNGKSANAKEGIEDG